ncbi:MAG: alpha/beta fold hydrolase [Candidatus Eisenbacteria bacterium]|uniref:Alpha/beta fold hydrolase n=1 Tax=Eiseniibacteriota bacterium TaxID=2212470 RepID=A0A849SME7_UNCEI|nr:alpha/beta fold hydrolase [Candidatus Eisenbacteria bacterium]
MSDTPQAPPVRLQSLELPGPAGVLEGLYQTREGVESAFAALVLHPHPLYGGTLHNKVVHRTATTLLAMGAAVLRFNFRGVGASAGRHDQGEGELEDARAAWSWLRARHPGARLWLAGFSFGSWVAARHAASDSSVERLALIAPPVGTQDFAMMRTATVDKLVLQGTADVTCPPEKLDAHYPTWSEPKRLIRIEGATHFFDRKLQELADALLAGWGAS